MRASALNRLAQFLDGFNHQVGFIRQFQRFLGVAVGVEDRRHFAGIGPRDGRDRPMGQHPFLHVKHRQGSIAQRNNHIAALGILIGPPNAGGFDFFEFF